MTSERIFPLSEYDRLPKPALSAEFYKHQLEVVCNNATLALFIMDEHQRCVYMNPAAENLTGYSLAETQGRALHDVIHHTRPDGSPYPLCECPIAQVFPQNNREQGEEVFVHKDGHFYPVAYTASPIREGNVMIGTIIEVRDITQEKLDEQARQDIKTILSSINDGFYTLDRYWRFTYVNDRYCEMAGKPRSELLGYKNWELFPATVGTDVYVQFHRAMHEQTFLQFEYLYSSCNRWFEYRVYPSPSGLTIFVVEVTDRKQAEESLRASEELKRCILESSMDCIKVLTLDSEIVYISPGGLCLLEVDDPALLLNARWLDFWQGEHYENAKTAIATAKAGNIGQFQGYLPSRNGTSKWWDSIVTPVWNSAGQVTQLVAISRDITKQRQVEEEREQLLAREQTAREAAENANRIKDEFLAVLSHELRSPLNPILGWTKLLKSGNLNGAKTRQALDTIERNTKLQTELIQDLLDVSRILQGKISLTIRPVDLAATVNAAIETVSLAAEVKAIEIQTQVNAIGQMLGDSSRLQQIVWNLVSNAVKFTAQGGRVEVRLEQVNNQAEITVADTGKGIKPEFLPYVFDYFRQEDGATTRKFGGLGLGLAIVRHLTELHGGTVWAESEGEGQGTTFRVRLPLLAFGRGNGKLEPPKSPSTMTDRPLEGIRVLVVDDEPDMRDVASFSLQQAGADVMTVVSAAAALTAIAQFQPNILVSDIGMPDMDGYALLRQVRSLSSDQGGQVLAIALTAYAAEFDQQQALQAGFQRHLAKPVEPDILVKEITRLLENN